MKMLLRIISVILITYQCHAQHSCYTSNQTALIPATCADYNEYIPAPQAPDLHYRINMHFFKPSSGIGVYDNVTISDCNTIVGFMNGMMANLQQPTLPVTPAAPFNSNAHIQFDLMGIYFHTDNQVYSSAGQCPTTVVTQYGVNTDSEVNIYFYNDPAIDGGCGLFGYVSMSGPNGISDQWVTAQLLIHELGHAIGGLNHTRIGDNDIFSDTYSETNSSSTWGWVNCAPSLVSNNIMGYNQCRNYMSPMQMGHYHMWANTGVTTKFTTLRNYNPSNSITVSSTETWTRSRALSGNLTVASGFTLTIQCYLFMPPTAKIIVERGAKLIVDGGVITSATKQLWYGIDAWGNSSLSQFTTGNSSQSTVEVKNGGVIEYMQTGIITDRPGYPGYHGAIIKLTDAVLLNNVRGVQLLSYSNFLPSSGTPASNQSAFQNTRFETTPLWQTIYGNPAAMISMDNVSGVKIRGCSFLNSTSLAQLSSLNRGTGISSLDASFSIEALSTTRSEFEGLTYGVNCSATNPLKSITVCYSDFNNNLRGVICTGLNYATMFLNTFNGNGSSTGYCLYLDGCSGYQIEQNSFNSLVALSGYGIYVRNSNNAANINGYGNSNTIYNNAFTNFQYACVAFDDNDGPSTYDGLRFNCNDYTGNSNDIYVGNSGASSITTDIGLYQGTSTGPTTYARNRYFANNCVTGQENQFGVAKSSPQAIYYHTNNATQMIPQCKDGLVLITTYSTTFNKTIHCPTNFGGGGSGRYAQINTLHFYRSEISRLSEETFAVIAELSSIIENEALSDSSVIDSVFQYPIGYVNMVLPDLNNRVGSISALPDQTKTRNGNPSANARETTLDSLIQMHFEFEILLNSVIADILRDSSSNVSSEVSLLLDTLGINNSALNQWIGLTSGTGTDSSGNFVQLNEINEIIYEVTQAPDIAFTIQSDTALQNQLLQFANDTNNTSGSALRAAESAQALLRYYLNTPGYTEVVGVNPEESFEQNSERLISEDEPQEIVLYPNPTSGTVHLKCDRDSNCVITEVKFIDVSGRIVANLVPIVNGTEVMLSCESLASGIYCCVIMSHEVILHRSPLVIKKE
jgi:hypothetical protein